MRNNRIVVGLAALALAAFIVAGCSNNEVWGEPLDSNGAACFQQGGQVYATAAGQSTLCGDIKNSGCTPEGECVSIAAAKTGGKFANMSGALELDGSIDPSMDCKGNCAPSFMVTCGTIGVVTLKGKEYKDRWACVPQLVEGVCHMKATAFPCDTGATCELVGKYPEYGHCLLCKADADCDDKNACTGDLCNLATGQCESTNLAKGTECDDGDKCNGVETCDEGVCKAGANPNCDDSKPCTDDSCDKATGCLHANNTVSCDDGDKCTEKDACSGGSCQPGSNPDCSDANPCTVDTCDKAKGCEHTNAVDTTACNDNDSCTTQDECAAGKCAGKPKSCDDGNACTLDSCKAADGSCVNAAVADATVCAEGAQCVAGVCELNSDVCTQNGATTCKQASGLVGYYECVVKTGAQKGTWKPLAICGEVGKAVCLDGEGCKLGGAEVNCMDGKDNDADGKADCADTDCAAALNCKTCTADAECNDGDPKTTDKCVNGKCVNEAPAPCTPQCTGKECGDDGCGGSCGTCAVGKSCDASNKCVAPPPPPPPECNADKPCPAGQFCGGGFCYEFLDLHGMTDEGKSGANGGKPDGRADVWDWDGDCFCASVEKECAGTSAAAGVCTKLQGGDCDELGKGNHPGVTDWIGDNYDNDCDGTLDEG